MSFKINTQNILKMRYIICKFVENFNMKSIILVSLLAVAVLVSCKGNRQQGSSTPVVAEGKSDIVSVVADTLNKPISAIFYGTDGKNDKKYIVQVVFYPGEERAVLTESGKMYELHQYVTASGFGYKNEDLDFWGKGKEATMTFTDEKIPEIELKQQN